MTETTHHFPGHKTAMAVLCSLALTGCVATGSALVPGDGAGAGTAAEVLLEPLDGGLVSRAGIRRLNRADLLDGLQSEYRALEYTAPGDLVTWTGRSGTAAGQIRPSQPYRVGTQDCRQYAHTVTGAGLSAPVVLRGTACRNPDGSWQLIS